MLKVITLVFLMISFKSIIVLTSIGYANQQQWQSMDPQQQQQWMAWWQVSRT